MAIAAIVDEMKIFISVSPKDTIKWGKKIATFLRRGDLIALTGELGSGKTTFTKGIAEGLGVGSSRYVNSPSFVIAKEYNGRLPLYHLDLYRLQNHSAIETTGYEEYICSDGVCVIEWAEKILSLLPKDYMRVQIYLKGGDKRLIKFIPKGIRYKELVKKIK